MAKKFPPGKCVHCLKYCEHPTRDHVFPQSWYPDTTPLNLEKWKIPSCDDCNTEYSKTESDLLMRCGICMNPQSPDTRGIPDKAMRAITPENGKDKGDMDCRFKARLKILQSIVPNEMIDYRAVLPYKIPSTAMEDPTGLLVPEKALKRMGEKFIRGITFVIDGLYIEQDHQIDVYFPHELDASWIIPVLRQHGKMYDRGPGISILRAAAPDDPQNGLYYMEIWNTFCMYGFVEPVA